MLSTYTDNFVKENFIYLSFWGAWTIMNLGIIGFIAYDTHKSNTLPIIAITVILIAGVLLAFAGISYILEALKTPTLNVDKDNLQFSYAGHTYEFCNLLPSYNVKKEFLKYRFSLHFKDGSELILNLPVFVGLAFAEKYLNVYSKPDSSLYL